MGEQLDQDIERVLFSESAIDERVKAMGEQIARDYQGKELLVVGILNGCFTFMADLVRAIDLPARIDFISVSSYNDGTRSSGVVRILKDLNRSIDDRHVLLVEDIIDTGLTLKYLCENLETRKPLSLQICTLLDKVAARQQAISVKYRGFTCPNEFVVGYGLDYAGRYRNLPYIGVLSPSIYEGP